MSSTAALSESAQAKVKLCHRTDGERAYVLIAVADAAVAAHLAHGDARVGEAVPGQPGMKFDSACAPVSSRQVLTTTGFYDGRSYWMSTFTVTAAGPVDATASVTSEFDLPASMSLALLGYNAQAGRSTCSTEWLPAPIPNGGAMSPPMVSAHWDNVPSGTYCLNVVSAIPAPPYAPPYSWSVTITYP